MKIKSKNKNKIKPQNNKMKQKTKQKIHFRKFFKDLLKKSGVIQNHSIMYPKCCLVRWVYLSDNLKISDRNFPLGWSSVYGHEIHRFIATSRKYTLTLKMSCQQLAAGEKDNL